MAGTGLAANPPGQPVAGLWHLDSNAPNYILSYDIAVDRDAPFNRSRTPLAARTLGAVPHVNSHARSNEARIASLASFHTATKNPSQGSLDWRYYAFGYWPYLEHLVFWGGSAGEGIVLAPNATAIDAAHRNGVGVLGNIFFPPNDYGGKIAWVENLVQTNGSRYPVADKLIEIAGHFGFDGWFINQETRDGDAVLAAAVRDFISYIKSNSTLQVMWYDAMIEDGTVSWEGRLDTYNDWFFQHNGAVVSDTMFLDFCWAAGWNFGSIESSRTCAQSLGRSPYDVYAGVNAAASGYGTYVAWTDVFPEGQAHRTSMGFLEPGRANVNNAVDIQDFQDRENHFWVGPNHDPGTTSTNEVWHGLAHYVPDRTAIGSLPFVTSFNAGQGLRWHINGTAMHPGSATWPWNNLGVQDVLPTWRWIVESASTNKLVPALAFDQAYYGGSSLRIAGTLDATNLVKLYKTSLTITNDTYLRIVCQLGTGGVPTHMRIALAFEDAPTAYDYLDVGDSTSNAWCTKEFPLAVYAGRRLAIIGLSFAASAPVTNYCVYVGQLAFHNGSVNVPAPPSNLILQEFNRFSSTSATLRLLWTNSPDRIRYYHVYRRNADLSLTWLWTTPNNACFVPCLLREGAETNTTIVLEAVGNDYGISSQIMLSVSWAVAQPNLVGHYEFENNVDDSSGHGNHGTAFGTPGYVTNADGSCAMQFNGSNSCVRLPRSIGDGSFTVLFWFQSAATNSAKAPWHHGAGLVDAHVPGTTGSFGTAILGEQVAFGLSYADMTLTSVIHVVNGSWHHAAAVFNIQTREMFFYVDGQMKGLDIGPTGPKNAASNLYLGCIATGSNYFAGLMDDVRLYDGPLMANEVAALTDGVDPFALPVITKCFLAHPGSCAVRASSVPGRIYQLESAPHPVTGPWQPIGSAGVATNYTWSFMVANTTNICHVYRMIETR